MSKLQDSDTDPKGHSIVFDDTPGSEGLFITSEGDLNIDVLHKLQQQVKGNETDLHYDDVNTHIKSGSTSIKANKAIFSVGGMQLIMDDSGLHVQPGGSQTVPDFNTPAYGGGAVDMEQAQDNANSQDDPNAQTQPSAQSEDSSSASKKGETNQTEASAGSSITDTHSNPSQTHWIQIQHQAPYANMPYRLTDSNGQKHEGTLDAQGSTPKIEGLTGPQVNVQLGDEAKLKHAIQQTHEQLKQNLAEIIVAFRQQGYRQHIEEEHAGLLKNIQLNTASFFKGLGAGTKEGVENTLHFIFHPVGDIESMTQLVEVLLNDPQTAQIFLEFGKAIYFGPQSEQQADYLDGQIGGNLFGSAITGAGMISLLLKGPEVFGLAASATSTVFKALYPRLPKLAELLTQLKKCKKLEAHVDEKHVVRINSDTVSSHSSGRSFDTFVTLGWKGNILKEPIGKELLIALKRENPHLPPNTLFTIAEELISSGKTLPKKELAPKELYKLAPKDQKISAHSPYFLARNVLQELKKNPRSLQDKLALPIVSRSSKYDIYIIHKKHNDAAFEVFTSEIAPSQEKGVKSTGGLKQTLVVNRSQWTAPQKIGELSVEGDQV